MFIIITKLIYYLSLFTCVNATQIINKVHVSHNTIKWWKII